MQIEEVKWTMQWIVKKKMKEEEEEVEKKMKKIASTLLFQQESSLFIHISSPRGYHAFYWSMMNLLNCCIFSLSSSLLFNFIQFFTAGAIFNGRHYANNLWVFLVVAHADFNSLRCIWSNPVIV
jgi:hypothetical protein